MINKDQNSLRLIKNFCKAFFIERNIENSIIYFSKNLVWTGPNKKCEISSYDNLKAIFSVDISLIPSPFKITPISELVFEVTPDVYNVNYSFKLFNKKKNISLSTNIFATILYKGSVAKIVTAKFDYIKRPDYKSNSFMHHAQGGLVVATQVNNFYYSINIINEQFSSLFNLDEEQSSDLINTNIFDYIYEDDVEIIQQLFKRNKNSNTPFSCNCRIKTNDKYVWIVALIVSKVEDSEIKYYIIARPTIDFESEIKKTIVVENRKEDTEESKTIYDQSGTHRNNFESPTVFEDVSDNFCSLLKYTKSELIKFSNYDYRKLIHKDDVEYFEQIYKKLKSNRPKLTFSYRLINKEGQSVWVNENIEIIKNKSGENQIYSIVTEIENLNDYTSCCNQKEIQLTPNISSKFLIVDLVNRKFETDTFKNSSINFTNKYVRNIPNSLIEDNIIYKEDQKGFLRFFNKGLVNQKNSWLGRIHLKNNKIGWYNILSYTLFNNKMPIKALCIIINVNSQKAVLERFTKQQEIIKLVVSDYEFFGEIDLLTNTPIFMYSPSQARDFYENNRVNNFEYLLNNVIHSNDVSKLIRIRDNTISHLFNNTLPANEEVEVQYRSITNRFEGYRWCSIKHIYKYDSESKHLHLIILIKNIDKQKRNELALLDNIKSNN